MGDSQNDVLNILRNQNEFLQHQLREMIEIIKNFSNKRNNVRTPIVVNQNGLFGIIRYLSEINPNYVRFIPSTISGDRIPSHLLIVDSTDWCSDNIAKSWICIHFPTKKVQLTGYLLRTYSGTNFPRSWLLEGSIDNLIWYYIDQKNNDTCLNQALQNYTFSCQCSSFYSYFRFTQTGVSSINNNHFILSFLELFGRVLEQE